MNSKIAINNTLIKVRKLNEMLITIQESDDVVNKIEEKLISTNPQLKNKAENQLKANLQKVKNAQSDEEVKNILKSDESLSKLPDDAKINILDAVLYIHSYLRKLGHGVYFSYVFSNMLIHYHTIKFLVNGNINKQDIQDMIKRITEHPVKTVLFSFLKSFIVVIFHMVATVSTLGLYYIWLWILSYKYIKKLIAMDISNYDLTYTREPKKESLPLPPTMEESIRLIYNKYHNLQLIS